MSMAMQLSELLQGWVQIPADADVRICELSTDSRDVCPGTLFIALEGLHHDARAFIPQALQKGAVAVLQSGCEIRVQRDAQAIYIEAPSIRQMLGQLADRFYGEASRKLALIGVTGTNGKSSVTHFIAQMLSELGQPTAVLGTLGYGFPRQLKEATHTTPDTLRLHREIADLQQQGAQAVAMEVSSHALDQDRVAGLHFRGAVFTNLSRDHLDYHGDMETYGAAKRRLFQREELQFAVINLDDAYGRKIATDLQDDLNLVTFALQDAAANLRVSDVQCLSQGFQALVHYQGQTRSLRCGLMGDFNLSNVLAAVGVLLSLGHPLEVVLNTAENLQPVPGRMQRVSNSGGPVVIVDYAHTPDALDQALRACAWHQPSRVWCVFGCGGDRDRGKRPLMAEMVARHQAYPIVTDDNPRTESPEQIVQDILAGIPVGVELQVLHDREQAIAWAIAQAADNDIVLIAGKGHEPYQEVQGVRKPFSDVNVAAQLLQACRRGEQQA